MDSPGKVIKEWTTVYLPSVGTKLSGNASLSCVSLCNTVGQNDGKGELTIIGSDKVIMAWPVMLASFQIGLLFLLG